MCIESGGSTNSPGDMDSSRVLYDKLALYLALIPTFLSQLVAIFLAIKYWGSPISIPPRHRFRWRWVLAVLIAMLELWLLCAMVTGDI